MWNWLHRLSSPREFFRISGYWIPWLSGLTVVLIVIGLYLGLFVAPPDYQQGESYRIIFIHVPSAWMSLMVYVVMACSGAVGLIWRIKLAHVITRCSAPIGASFTFLALATGSLWGKPMWGTWWVWDARLTSELLLLFLYLGVIALYQVFENQRSGDRAAALLAIVGVINIPIIHYSVEWWNTLHQGATITKLDAPSIDTSMLIPLLIMAVAFLLFYKTLLLFRARYEILWQQRRNQWAMEHIKTL